MGAKKVNPTSREQVIRDLRDRGASRSKRRSPKLRTQVKPSQEEYIDVPIAHPIYPQNKNVASPAQIPIYSRSAEIASELDVYGIPYRGIEPFYIPAQFDVVKLSAEDMKCLSEACEFIWTSKDYEGFSRIIGRAIFAIVHDQEISRAKSLIDRFDTIMLATRNLQAAFSLKTDKELHPSILPDVRVVDHFLSTRYNVESLLLGVGALEDVCNQAIAKLREKVGAGAPQDLILDVLLGELISMCRWAGISLEVAASRRRPSPLFALSREVCRMVTLKGLEYLNSLQTDISSAESTRKSVNILNELASRSNEGLAKKLRIVLRKPSAHTCPEAVLTWQAKIDIFKQAYFSGHGAKVPYPVHSVEWWHP